MMIKNKGFTLIELLVSLAIISIISISLFKIVNLSIENNSKNDKRISAMNVAQNIVEDAKYKISTIDDLNRKQILDSITAEGRKEVVDNVTYYVDVVIMEYLDLGNRNLYTIKVRVGLSEDNEKNYGEIITRICEN